MGKSTHANEDTSIPKITVQPSHAPTTSSTPAIPNTQQTVVIDNRDTSTAPEPASLQSLYQIVLRIADGGMGVIFLAQDRRLGRYVAIKRLNRMSLANASLKERFLREAKAIAALNHIHIVHIYALGDDHEGPYIVMEYVPGPVESTDPNRPPKALSLGDRVATQGVFSANEALDMTLKIARAIEYAHSRGIVHRDLKPSNILLDPMGEPKIVDFGLARIFDDKDLHLTVTGDRMLSLGYGAPEQEEDASKADARADLYSLGALLFFMLTGKNPRYYRENDVPDALRSLVSKSLQTDKDRRWQTAHDFVNAILTIRTPTTLEVASTRTTWRCKWCDTVNPVAIRYCGNCGWDGSETCPECGAEIRVGIPYCGSCGVDVREYEMAGNLLSYLERQRDKKDFETLLQNADRISTFRPAGTSGRRVVEKIRKLRSDAEQSIRRRKELETAIPLNMETGKLETARIEIREYNALSTTPRFAAELERIPAMLRDRDLQRAREALASRDLAAAERLCDSIQTSGSAGDPEVARLRTITRRLHYVRLGMQIIVGLFVVSLAYILLVPVWYRSKPDTRTNSAILTPLRALHERTAFQRPLKWYAWLWDAATMFDASGSSHSGNPNAVSPHFATLAQLQQDFREIIMDLEARQIEKFNSLLSHYTEELKGLLARTQKDGDYEAWQSVANEAGRMELDHSLPVEDDTIQPAPLRDLANKYRRQATSDEAETNRKKLAAARDYLNHLNDLQKQLTKKNNMQDAAEVNTEIKRIKSDPALEALGLNLATQESGRIKR